MIVPGSISALLIAIARYLIPKALSFVKASSQYLTRTFGTPTNKYSWTLSVWVKRGSLATNQAIFSNSSNDQIRFDSSNRLQWLLNGASTNIVSTAAFTDLSKYAHFLFVMDAGNGVSTDRMRVYVDSARITSWGTATFPSTTTPTTSFNTATGTHRIGDYSGTTLFDGLMAEINFIDGQALNPSDFGETLGGVWWPKKYAGTYGANGFFLDFADPSSTTTLGTDKSGNGNSWTLTNMTTANSTTVTPTS